jgi:hypothetical protein
MELHFGYNCKGFLPTLGKCRTLIDNRKSRKDLVEQRWLTTGQVLVYLNLSHGELIGQITSGEIKVRRQKDGTVMFWVSTTWQHDDCFLANSGGQCLYFAPHAGKTISYLEQRKGIELEHPNYATAPSDAEIREIEHSISPLVGDSAQIGDPAPRVPGGSRS